MAYPTDVTVYTTKIDKNASGWYVGLEYFNVPATSPYEMYLDHVPRDTTPSTVTAGASGGAAWTEVTASPTTGSQFYIDYDTGKVTFHSSNASAAVYANYYNLGDDIMAAHMNEIQTEIYNTETTLGHSPQASYDTVSDRLNDIEYLALRASGISGDRFTDNTVRAGALRDDIKGTSWVAKGRKTLEDIYDHEHIGVAAHTSAAITTLSPGIATFTTVEGHINAGGAGNKEDTNPHGLSFADIDIGRFDDLTVATLTASGNYISIGEGVGETDKNQYLYFYEGSKASGVHIAWDDANDKFTMNDGLEIAGAFEAGAITASGNIFPPASGSHNIGTLAVPWAAGNFDSIQAVSYKTGESTGTDGNFTTVDGKTITVKNGIIVNIV